MAEAAELTLKLLKLGLGRDQFADTAFGPANRSSRFNNSYAWERPQYLWPRAVGIPRLTSSAAMVYGVVMPVALMSAITGASAMAVASARRCDALRPAAAASGVATIAA